MGMDGKGEDSGLALYLQKLHSVTALKHIGEEHQEAHSVSFLRALPLRYLQTPKCIIVTSIK